MADGKITVDVKKVLKWAGKGFVLIGNATLVAVPIGFVNSCSNLNWFWKACANVVGIGDAVLLDEMGFKIIDELIDGDPETEKKDPYVELKRKLDEEKEPEKETV